MLLAEWHDALWIKKTESYNTPLSNLFDIHSEHKPQKHFTVLKLHQSDAENIPELRRWIMVDPFTFVTPKSWSERDAGAVNTPTSSITVLPIWLTETVYMHYTLSDLLLLSGSSVFFFFSWILSFLQTLHTSWPSELAPSFTSASHSFPFFPTPLSLYVWNAPRHSDGSLEGLDLFVVAPLSHGEMAIREKRVTSQLFFCKFPHFHLCTNRRGVLLSPWRRGSARGFWICWLL